MERLGSASGRAPALRGGTPATTWPAPRIRPDSYPGSAPEYPYLLVGDSVYPLRVRSTGDLLRITTEDGTLLDSVLADLGGAPLETRVPTIGYGANRSPHSFALKFAHHNPELDRRTTVLPVLAGSMPDVDAVAAGVSSQGFVFAELARSPGTSLDVMVALLDPDQLAAMHDSEDVGRMYDCAWMPGVSLGDSGGSLAGLTYLGRRPHFRLPDHSAQPLAFAIVPARGRLYPGLSQVEMMTRIVDVTDCGAELADLLQLGGEPKPLAIARELIRLLNGQWWYSRNTGDSAMKLAVEAQHVLVQAMDQPAVQRTDLHPQAPLLSPDEAYYPGAGYTLKAQVELP